MCPACLLSTLEDYKLPLPKCLVNPNCSASLILFELGFLFFHFPPPAKQCCFHVSDAQGFHKKWSYARTHILELWHLILPCETSEALFCLEKGQSNKQ